MRIWQYCYVQGFVIQPRVQAAVYDTRDHIEHINDICVTVA